jgi:hypothetical protein
MGMGIPSTIEDVPGCSTYALGEHGYESLFACLCLVYVRSYRMHPRGVIHTRAAIHPVVRSNLCCF